MIGCKDYFIDGQNTRLIFFLKVSKGEGSKALKLHPEGGIFGPWSFIILQKFTSKIYIMRGQTLFWIY